ncbi:MAG: hypothetical protein ACK4H7_00605 [Acidilobaceae archaeon]
MSLSRGKLGEALEKLRAGARARYEARRTMIINRYEALVRDIEEKYREVVREFAEIMKG